MFSLTYFLFGFAAANSLALLSSDGNASTIMQNSTEALPATSLAQSDDTDLQNQTDNEVQTILVIIPSVICFFEIVASYSAEVKSAKSIKEKFVARYDSSPQHVFVAEFKDVVDNSLNITTSGYSQSLMTSTQRAELIKKFLKSLKSEGRASASDRRARVIDGMRKHLAPVSAQDSAGLADYRPKTQYMIWIAEIVGIASAVYGIYFHVCKEWTQLLMWMYLAPLPLFNILMAFRMRWNGRYHHEFLIVFGIVLIAEFVVAGCFMVAFIPKEDQPIVDIAGETLPWFAIMWTIAGVTVLIMLGTYTM
jgi:hypothetical protein